MYPILLYVQPERGSAVANGNVSNTTLFQAECGSAVASSNVANTTLCPTRMWQ